MVDATLPLYLDYAATTPLDPRVRDRMLSCMDAQQGFGNPSSVTHAFGTAAQLVVDESARDVAALVGGDAEYLLWTSGATESDNLAVMGAAFYRQMRGRHVITAVTEHKAVLESCAELERRGFSVTYLEPDSDGLIAPTSVAAALRPDTILVSIMHANNEIGVVQDIAALGELCRNSEVLFHVDAAQSAGKLQLNMCTQQIDLLTLNAHKACGPKGIGALLLNPATLRRIEPLSFGGGQQRGMRAGTLPVHQIVGMGATYALLAQEMHTEVERVEKLRDDLWQGISRVPGVVLNGHPDRRLASILNVSVNGIEGESLRYALQALAVASGAACNSTAGQPSYVLRSLGHSDALAEASIRFSLGRFSTEQDVAQAVRVFCDAVDYLQSLAPAPLAVNATK